MPGERAASRSQPFQVLLPDSSPIHAWTEEQTICRESCWELLSQIALIDLAEDPVTSCGCAITVGNPVSMDKRRSYTLDRNRSCERTNGRSVS
jgi:hypothetical protein